MLKEPAPCSPAAIYGGLASMMAIMAIMMMSTMTITPAQDPEV